MTRRYDVVTHLTRIKKKLEKGWCQGTFARDADGREAFVESPAACSWCVLGALDASYGDSDGVWNEGLTLLALALPPKAKNVGLAKWNDDPKRTKAQVLALYDRAIAKLERKAS